MGVSERVRERRRRGGGGGAGRGLGLVGEQRQVDACGDGWVDGWIWMDVRAGACTEVGGGAVNGATRTNDRCVVVLGGAR